MYNRYYPDDDGVFRKETRTDPAIPELPAPKKDAAPDRIEKKGSPFSFLPGTFDIGDLLTLFVLLTIADDKPENRTSALMTLAFYFFG